MDSVLELLKQEINAATEGAVVQGENRGSLARFANLPVEILLAPLREPLGLVLGQVGFHGK